MEQTEFNIQLQVWKDLAIHKQVLMGAATDALGLDPECNSEDLKTALDAAIKRSMAADSEISEAKEQARIAAEVMQHKAKENADATEQAIIEKEEAQAATQAIEQQMQAARAANAQEVKKVKTQLAEEQKKLKSVKNDLGDTPVNILKKLKALNKQKTDDTNAKKRAEEATRSLRKEKQKLEQQIRSIESAIAESAEMAESYRELHKTCKTMHGLLKGVDDRPALPVLNDKKLEGIEATAKTIKDKKAEK